MPLRDSAFAIVSFLWVSFAVASMEGCDCGARELRSASEDDVGGPSLDASVRDAGDAADASVAPRDVPLPRPGLQCTTVATTSKNDVFHGLWGFGTECVWASSKAEVFSWCGGQLTKRSTGLPHPLTAFWGTSPDSVLAISNLAVVQMDGGTWTTPPQPAAMALTSLCGVPGGATWAVGFDVMRQDGAGWQKDSPLPVVPVSHAAWISTPELRRVWGAAPDAMWAVGQTVADPLMGVVVRRQSDGWHVALVAGGLTSEFNDVWGASADDVWVLGQQDYAVLMLHWDGTVWTEVPVSAPPELASQLGLRRLWGFSSRDVWAVGGEGTFAHWNGTAWSVIASSLPLSTLPHLTGDDVGLQDVWSANSHEIWLTAVNSPPNQPSHGEVLHCTLR